VIARDQPAHRDVVGPNLEARLVDFNDHAAAAAAIRHALAMSPDDAAALGERERERASIFDLPRLVAELDQLYARITRPA
jgi:hypothetical protein